jgi:hypothetical protein
MHEHSAASMTRLTVDMLTKATQDIWSLPVPTMLFQSQLTAIVGCSLSDLGPTKPCLS